MQDESDSMFKGQSAYLDTIVSFLHQSTPVIAAVQG